MSAMKNLKIGLDEFVTNGNKGIMTRVSVYAEAEDLGLKITKIKHYADWENVFFSLDLGDVVYIFDVAIDTDWDEAFLAMVTLYKDESEEDVTQEFLINGTYPIDEGLLRHMPIEDRVPITL